MIARQQFSVNFANLKAARCYERLSSYPYQTNHARTASRMITAANIITLQNGFFAGHQLLALCAIGSIFQTIATNMKATIHVSISANMIGRHFHVPKGRIHAFHIAQIDTIHVHRAIEVFGKLH